MVPIAFRVSQKASALIRIIRPELPASAGVCVVVGQILALGAFPSLRSIALGFSLGFLLSGSAMVFNDYFDLEVDRINAPERPLPAGLLSAGEALAYGLGLALAALALAWAAHAIVFGLRLAVWVLGFLYNWRLKAGGVGGNLIVAGSVGMTFLMGGTMVGQMANPMLWIFSGIAFLFDLAEEIAGDAMDMAGDQKRSSQSIALRFGKTAALRISGLLFGLVICLTLAPVLWGESSWKYWVSVALIDLPVIFFTRQLLRSQTPQAGRRCMRAAYLSATAGLVVYILAALFG